MKLVQHLDSKDPDWRMNTVLMLDNVIFHRGHIAMAVYHALKVPILFLGPYHFRMSLAELAFNYIKSHDLPTQLRYVNTM